MPNCTSCGEKVFTLDDELGRCLSCANANKPAIRPKTERKTESSHELITRRRQAEQERQTEIDAILVTTAHTLQGIEVTKYLGFVSTECAYGMNMFKDMFANVRNLVGGRSAAVEDTMRDSREAVLLDLKREAYAKGANAVIAVDLDYTQLGAGGNMMVLVTASGTAVVIKADEGV